MRSISLQVRKLLGDNKGVTAIEYGLIAGAIAIAIIGAVFSLGGSVTNMFNTASSALSTVGGASSTTAK